MDEKSKAMIENLLLYHGGNFLHGEILPSRPQKFAVPGFWIAAGGIVSQQAEHRQERNGEYGISIVSAWTGGRGGVGETLW